MESTPRSRVHPLLAPAVHLNGIGGSAPWRLAFGLLVVLPFAALILSCGDSDLGPSASLQGPAASPSSAGSTDEFDGASDKSVVVLPFESSASDLLIDDFDEDGRPDIALVSHRANVLQVFHQKSPREFVGGRLVPEVGFHPGNLLRLPREQPPRYLLSAEAQRRLFAMTPDAHGGLTVAAEMAFPYARYSLPFTWPDWPNALAVATFSPASVVLLKGLDPVAGSFDRESAVRLPLKETVNPLTSLTVADLDGDQIDEILLATPATGKLWQVRYPADGGAPAMEPLWEEPPLGPVRQLIAYDLNQDGRPDLVAPAEASMVINGKVADINLLMNLGEGSLQRSVLPFRSLPPTENGLAGIAGVRGVAANTDRDGYVYLLAAGYDHLELFRVPKQGRPEAAASRQLPYTIPDSASRLELQDLDGDGWLDAVIARRIAGQGGLVIFGPLWDYFAQPDAALPAPPPLQLPSAAAPSRSGTTLTQ